MKKSRLSIIALAVVFTAFMASCNSSAKKVEKAEQELQAANEELEKANAELMADIESFKQEKAIQIEANNQSIAEFKSRAVNQKKEVQAEYAKKIEELEQKNSAMKLKMEEYQADSKDNWENFKVEFSRDMDELGKSFKDFTVKNTK